jgi:hypothetical protein
MDIHMQVFSSSVTQYSQVTLATDGSRCEIPAKKVHQKDTVTRTAAPCSSPADNLAVRDNKQEDG